MQKQSVSAMDNIFEQLTELLHTTLHELNMGCCVDSKKLDKMWTLIHVLHYSSFVEDASDLNKIINFYYE